MKLSEAILLGSTLSPQMRGMFESPGGSRCALGAALAAVGVTRQEYNLKPSGARGFLVSLWPELDEKRLLGQCPYCETMFLTLIKAIVHFNDEHGLTREEIAAWTSQFESADVQVQDIRDEHTDCGPGPGIALLEVPAL